MHSRAYSSTQRMRELMGSRKKRKDIRKRYRKDIYVHGQTRSRTVYLYQELLNIFCVVQEKVV